jgi:hypothetical protein
VFPFVVSQTFNRQANNPNYITLSNPFPTAGKATVAGVTNANGYDSHAATPYMQSWNFTVERDLGHGAAIEAAYTGSKGSHLGRRYDINQPFRSVELRQPSGTFPRPISGLNMINFYAFESNSSYNAATATLRKRFAKGLFFRANYVSGKSIDDASQVSGNSDGGYPGAQDARNLRLERGRSDWDNRHAVTMMFLYDLPGIRSRLLRGWQLGGTGRMYSGQPFTPRVSNVQTDLGEANRPDRIANGALDNRTVEQWFDLSAFPVVPTGAYRFGNSGRNILDGPGTMAVNASLVRKFALRERSQAQFRWEVFNVFNHANFDLPNNNVNAAAGGTITSASAPRVMQFAIRVQF